MPDAPACTHTRSTPWATANRAICLAATVGNQRNALHHHSLRNGERRAKPAMRRSKTAETCTHLGTPSIHVHHGAARKQEELRHPSLHRRRRQQPCRRVPVHGAGLMAPLKEAVFGTPSTSWTTLSTM